MTIEIPCAVGHMDAVLVKWDLISEGHHFDRLHKVFNFSRCSGLDPVADLHKNLPFQGRFIMDKPPDGIQLAVNAFHGMCLQE